MSKGRVRARAVRTDIQAQQQSNVGFLLSSEAYETLCVSGYTTMDKSPEVLTACRKISDMISSMTIYLMANTELGDQRITNRLSRKVDIHPNRYMTRKTWMDAIVMNMLLYGKGNSIAIPYTKDGQLEDIYPIAPSRVSFRPEGYGYTVLVDGTEYNPDDLMHFVNNPDPENPWRGLGLTATLKDVANNLKQAAATEKAFMASKWKPSVIVKVDGMVDEFSSPAGRKKLLNEYISTNEAGEPWIIPADQFAIEQIKPLSLSDLAISDVVQINKKTVAAILGVPPFVLGVGEYKAAEWDAFISNTIRPIARAIEQELTRKLLISPKMYWQFNIASLYSYDLKTTADVYSNLFVRGIVTGNEVRDKIGASPLDGLDNLTILENYIPLDKIGDQLKLKQEDESDG